MARGAFPGRYPRTPSRSLLAELRPDPARARPGCAGDRLPTAVTGPAPARSLRRVWGVLRSLRPFGGVPSLATRGRSEATVEVCRGHLRWLLGACRRIFASETVGEPHLRFETGGGAASSFLALLRPPPRAAAAGPGIAFARGARPLWAASRRARSTSCWPAVHFAHTHMTLRLRRAAIAEERSPCVARKAIRARWYTTRSRRGCEPGKQCTAGAHTIVAISQLQTRACSV